MFKTYLFKFPWYKDDPRMYHYGLVPDEAEREKYNTAEKLLMRMDFRLNNAYARVEKYSLTPIPPFVKESPFRVLEKWSSDEYRLRLGNCRRHPLHLCNTLQYKIDRKMENKAVKVIRDLHIFCSCAARIIQLAWRKRKRGSELKPWSEREEEEEEKQYHYWYDPRM